MAGTEEQRAKQREYSRRWRAENPEKSQAIIKRQYESRRAELLAAQKARYDADPGKYRARNKQWYENNKDEALKQAARWQAANPEKVIAAKRKWRANNAEKQRAATARWAAAHPEKTRQRANRHRARKVNARGSYTVEQLAARVAFYGGVCAYCRSAPYEHMDHVIPLSRGGTNWPSNHRPACMLCNASKGNKLLSEWKRPGIGEEQPCPI